MSSAVNHRKRSHRSEMRKSGVYQESTRKAIFREYRKQKNQSLFGRLWQHWKNQRREAAQAKQIKEETA